MTVAVDDGIVRLGALHLRYGAVLAPCEVAYRTLGVRGRPAVLVLGGISAGRDVAGDGTGWWRDFVGPCEAVDTKRFFVIGVDYLGGQGASTGPSGLDQSIDTQDQARACVEVLNHLDVACLHGLVGSSYGGMVALSFAALFPDRVQRLVVISAAHRPHPMATALRSAQRNLVRLNASSPNESASLAIARAIAMTTYRSEREFRDRFKVEPYRVGTRFRFPVEDYLDHAGTVFASRVTPHTFVPLSESIDLHRVEPESISTPTTLIAVDEDRLVPEWLIEELRDAIAGPVYLHTIRSVFGHDAFLKEVDVVSSIVNAGLEEPHE